MLRGEVLTEHLVETPEVPRVFQPHADPDHILERITGFLKNCDQVAHGLVRLLDDAADDNLAILRRHLAGNVQPAVSLDCAGEWAWLAAPCCTACAITGNSHEFFLVLKHWTW